jgi:hypothetical protein
MAKRACGLNFSLLVSYNYRSGNILCPVRLAIQCCLSNSQPLFNFYFGFIAAQFLPGLSPHPLPTDAHNEIRNNNFILNDLMTT